MSDGFIDIDNIYFYAINNLNMTDSVFWDSSLQFIFKQFDKFSEMNEKAKKESNKHKPKNNKKANYEERTETKSYRMLSSKEIAEIRAKASANQ